MAKSKSENSFWVYPSEKMVGFGGISAIHACAMNIHSSGVLLLIAFQFQFQFQIQIQFQANLYFMLFLSFLMQ